MPPIGDRLSHLSPGQRFSFREKMNTGGAPLPRLLSFMGYGSDGWMKAKILDKDSPHNLMNILTSDARVKIRFIE